MPKKHRRVPRLLKDDDSDLSSETETEEEEEEELETKAQADELEKVTKREK